MRAHANEFENNNLHSPSAPECFNPCYKDPFCKMQKLICNCKIIQHLARLGKGGLCKAYTHATEMENNRVDWSSKIKELIPALQTATSNGDNDAPLEIVFAAHENHVPQREGLFLLKVDAARTTDQPPSMHWNCREWHQPSATNCKIRRLHAPGLEARQICFENSSVWSAVAVVVKQVVAQVVRDAGDDMIDDSMEMEEIWPVMGDILIQRGRRSNTAVVNMAQSVGVSASGANPNPDLDQMQLSLLPVLQAMAREVDKMDEELKKLE